MPIIAQVVIFIIALSILVVVHELGHFLVAKVFKVVVEEFGLGYPPRAKKLFKKWGTVFTLNWIPFGGFVKLEGELWDEAEAKSSQAKKGQPFYDQPAWVRAAVLVAGPAINILLGALLFATVFSFWGIPSGAIIGQVLPGSAADKAHLPTGVAITGLVVNGQRQPITTVADAVPLIKQQAGQTVEIQTTGPCHDLVCDQTGHTYSVALRSLAEQADGNGTLGVGFIQNYVRFYPWYQMPFLGMKAGFYQSRVLVETTLTGLSGLVGQSVRQGQLPKELVGPVGLGHEFVQSDLVSGGALAVVYFAAVLSITLGVMNLLPIPALDGGRLLFVALEKIVGRRWVRHYEGYINYGGFVVLMTLFVIITARDIINIFF